ncbi:MAG: hypothetical protein MUE36_13030 [Acidimicrobiales bacterium]|jgi:hypothetical protein|nr:hypothetical protein [Acidimicrobiales bacterium]
MAETRQGDPTGWVGWIFFAGVMMILGGSLNAVYGLIALLNDEWVVWGNRGTVYLDITQWGWVHLILGVLVLASGFGVLAGNVFARTIGVIVTAIAMVGSFLAMPIYPLWSVTLLVIEVLVLWALIVHGREVRE